MPARKQAATFLLRTSRSTVIGGVPSVLQGALNATGRIYILNSAGITFTGTSHVNVGALLATTAMTVDGDPTQSLSFSGVGGGQRA
jgi:filamentous hemagglutinin family protein